MSGPCRGGGKGVSFALVWGGEGGEENWRCSGGWDGFLWGPTAFPESPVLGWGTGRKGEFRLEWENLITNSSFWGGTADSPSCSGRQKKENWQTVEKK